MKNYKESIKIFVIMVVSFIVVKTLSPSIFLANTPSINKTGISQLLSTPQKMFAMIRLTGSKQKPTQIQTTALNKIKKLPDSSLNLVGTGVYAKEDIENNVVYIRVTKDAEWEERTINYEGKEMKIRFPKGSLNQ